MMDALVRLETKNGVAEIVLNDPDRRNALGVAMFAHLRDAVERVRAHKDDVRAVLLRGEGSVFCAGFDLSAAVGQPALMGEFIQRLSQIVRAIRRLPQPVTAAVQGAAIAGGCALLSACDFVFVERMAKLGYPVHEIGVSPAVTLPTLMQAIGAGPARGFVMSGALIEGEEAYRLGLATHLVGEGVAVESARAHCAMMAAKPAGALLATKAWLNELDNSLDDGRFDGPAEASAAIAAHDEAVGMLRAAWSGRLQGR